MAPSLPVNVCLFFMDQMEGGLLFIVCNACRCDRLHQFEQLILMQFGIPVNSYVLYMFFILMGVPLVKSAQWVCHCY